MSHTISVNGTSVVHSCGLTPIRCHGWWRSGTMRAQRSFRVEETVTSDTSLPDPKPHTITVTGREFVDSEPYGSPPDPNVAMLRRPGGHTVLLFGLPAEGVHVELEVDTSYRIVRETL